MAQSVCERRYTSVSAIHVRLDERAERRDRESCQPHAQPADDSTRVWTERVVDHRGLAAALSRYGFDRKRFADALCRRALRAHVARGVFAESVSLVAGDLDGEGDDEWRAKLRLRPLRAKSE